MNAPFHYAAGTGGIGKGVLFLLEGAHDLGRNESRLGRLTDYEDFCKLHIILHYAAVLSEGAVPVYAIGRVGKDEAGTELVGRMGAAGIHTDHVRQDGTAVTMYAVCFQYPNGDGGNITTSNSACSLVSGEDVAAFFRQHDARQRGLLLAAPEVPLNARMELLSQGKRRGCLTIASILSDEAEAFLNAGGLELTDVLALNGDEAQAVIRASGQETGQGPFAEACAQLVRRANPNIVVLITDGGAGAYCFHPKGRQFMPGLSVDVVNTAGAGDCFLGTIMAGMMNGVPLAGEMQEGIIASAFELGVVAAAMKVTQPHTIHFGINRAALADFARSQGFRFSPELQHIWERSQQAKEDV